MVDRANGRKKSNFVAKTSVDAGSYVDYFVNGTNYKISYDNFVSGLGVTGSMAQAGPVTASPVLNIDGTVNNIRGIEGGSGITTAISAEDGVQVSHSFSADSTGSPLLLDTAAASPVVASLVAGTGITLTSTDNYVTIESIEAATYGQVTIHDNATATVISATDTPVLVAGTWTAGITSQFTASAAGRLTYTGTPDSVVMAHASVTIEPVGTNQVISIFFAKDGVAIADSEITRTVSSGQSGNVSLNYNIAVQTNDYIEIYVSNATSTNNVTVIDALFGVA